MVFFLKKKKKKNEENSMEKEMTEEQKKNVGKVKNPFCKLNKSQNVTCISL